MTKLFACDACHYLFESSEDVIQCPDCGKYKVRPANQEETEEFASRRLDEND